MKLGLRPDKTGLGQTKLGLC